MVPSFEQRKIEGYSPYSRLYSSILFPLYEGVIRGRNTITYIRDMEYSQWLSTEKIAECQLERITKLLQHAYDNVPYYRNLMQGLRVTPADFAFLDDFQGFPTLDKEIIRNNFSNLLATNYVGKVLKKSTGGSTGEPLHFAYTRESYERRIAATARGYGWAGCRDGERTLYVVGAPIGKEPLSARIKQAAYNAVLHRKIFNSFSFTEEKIEECLREINRLRPTFIVGYTNALYNLAQFIKKRASRPFKPRAILTAAEKLFSYQRSSIEEAFQCPLFETYGSREFMLIGSECDKHNGLHLSAENLYVEFLKDGKPVKPGEVGEIVITDFHNYGMPFIRYKIGDLGVPSGGRCDCNRGLPMIERIEGRLLDTIQTPDGRLVPGEFFPRLMRQIPEVKKFRVLQEDIRSLKITLATDPNFPETAQDFLSGEVRKVFGDQLRVDFEFVPDIAPSASGKFRVVTSKVPINFNS